jgi:hypothetical protein
MTPMSIEPGELNLQVEASSARGQSFYDVVKDILFPIASLIGMFPSFKPRCDLRFFPLSQLSFGSLRLYSRLGNWRISRRERAKEAEIVAQPSPRCRN